MKTDQNKTFCLGGGHYSNTNNITEYENVNPKTKKIIKIFKGICGRNKTRIFSI